MLKCKLGMQRELLRDQRLELHRNAQEWIQKNHASKAMPEPYFLKPGTARKRQRKERREARDKAMVLTSLAHGAFPRPQKWCSLCLRVASLTQQLVEFSILQERLGSGQVRAILRAQLDTKAFWARFVQVVKLSLSGSLQFTIIHLFQVQRVERDVEAVEQAVAKVEQTLPPLEEEAGAQCCSGASQPKDFNKRYVEN